MLWKEVPFVKVTMPHRYKPSFNLFGFELASIALAGESDLVSEDNS